MALMLGVIFHLSALFIGSLLIIRGRPLGAWLKAVVTKREQNL